MLEAIFISDLHLHPEDSAIQERFNHFLKWARVSVKKIYILGDFFHAWAGDDSINEWSKGIARQLYELTLQGISIYYMCGNRDFLLGKKFAKLAGWTILQEPTLVKLGGENILLTHGDRYCTKDIGHQRLRRLTRNPIFVLLFLSLSLKFRERIVNKVRTISSNKQNKPMEEMDVVAESVIAHMTKYQVRILVHGHTHKPGLTQYQNNMHLMQRFVLSDWDDTPQVLCYHNTKGFYFTHPQLQEEYSNV
ncbi:UDP-2,3-diacylglucosamine diphosphatase [Legionella quateirensis]|uniref:UDP-2,3-diacylglucosamine hydrolase n=1 Tax=Legionella quateirensis TaxID=45072 RepID=A0A378KWA9_9GAMM|nr:UDP-2,3-diacylglucosamine diphosphatase [Legionella quateirensis]KTD50957.1 UDP-2,3-diacylglucosamine hydrolase [Legionella quateirensis]STY17797.1 UDP-2,3-diacylglucosamine hydrolase [Legionella quateirensis]